MSLLVLGDLFCFAFPFAWLFGRMGCFVVHDHPGLPTNFFLAVDNYNLQGIARHDLGLYEVLWSAVMIPLLLWMGKTKRPWGFYMALVPLAYAPLRFCLDFLRESAEQGGDVRYLGLTPGHYASVLMTLTGVAVAIRVARGPAAALSLDGDVPTAPSAADARPSSPAASKAKKGSGRKARAK
jgi:phosphatidylglycerol:prolipoprotein diacylglycerol transferase